MNEENPIRIIAIRQEASGIEWWIHFVVYNSCNIREEFDVCGEVGEYIASKLGIDIKKEERG